jgi:eukaryotic-like serine/threonine-protein kinase
MSLDETLQGTLPGVAVAPADAPLVGGRYRIVRWLGGGSMGRVYEAHDVEIDEHIALKVLKDSLSETALERFRREVRLTRRIVHPNVARVYDIGEHAGERFLTMALIDGEPLSRLVGAAMPWPELRALALQLCAGLAAAHALGIVHRDLKPDNVLVERGGRVVITDFGIARSVDDAQVTQVGTVIGTPRYMAPEQLAGEPVDARADVFSLGVMLYELASGRRPWEGDSPITLAVAQATRPPLPLRARLPTSAIALIESCIAVERDRRPISADAIAEALGREDSAPVASAVTTGSGVVARVELPESTIAVLPLRCSPDDEYLADWLHDDLLHALAMTPQLRVKPTRERGNDPRAIGRTLSVDHVIEGAIRRVPSGLSISVRLIGVADGFQIWAHRSEHAEAELLTVSDHLAREITQALSTRATTRYGAVALDPRAVQLYVRARAELRGFWNQHAETAAELLEQALVYAPESSEILGAYALATVQAWLRGGVAERERHARARDAIARALPVPEAYLASAQLRMNEGEVVAGAEDLARALVRAPMSAPAHEIAARVMMEVELVDKARQHFAAAIELDPGRASLIAGDLARLDALCGAWDAAFARIEAKEDNPSHQHFRDIMRSRLATWLGDFGRDHAIILGGLPENLGLRDALVAARAGQPFDLVGWQDAVAPFRTTDRPRRMQLLFLQRAVEIVLLIGEREAATTTLDAACEGGLIDLLWLRRCPLLAPLIATPRGKEVLAIVESRATRIRAAFEHALTR